jgi:stress response protein YsnF
MSNQSQVKKELFELCEKIIEDRISTLEQNLDSIQESKNEETKSSAGDKYETGRAMLQIEEDNYKKQLHQVLLLKNQLEQLNISRQTEKIEIGSLVITDQANYFISIGLGEIVMETKTYYCISGASPIGQKLMDQMAGSRIEFNGKSIKVREVY